MPRVHRHAEAVRRSGPSESAGERAALFARSEWNQCSASASWSERTERHLDSRRVGSRRLLCVAATGQAGWSDVDTDGLEKGDDSPQGWTLAVGSCRSVSSHRPAKECAGQHTESCLACADPNMSGSIGQGCVNGCWLRRQSVRSSSTLLGIGVDFLAASEAVRRCTVKG